jgi:hypothetical protein
VIYRLTALFVCQLLLLQASAQQVQVGFGNTDTRYPREQVPSGLSETITLSAWKGEKLNAQVLVYSEKPINKLRVQPGDPAIKAGFVEYVMSDGLNKDGGGCGTLPIGKADSVIMADPVFNLPYKKVNAGNTQAVWLSIQVPREAPTGTWQKNIQIVIDDKTYPLTLRVGVSDRMLPPPAEWQFHLDLWQNPFSIARVHKLKPWSRAHLEAMKPYMRMLAAAGQKAVTVSMIHDPWRGQTYDIYQSMIRWVKKKDGSWQYDYTIFDQWVTFMQEMGIGKVVNCYSMVPWNNKFYYYDETFGKDTVLIAATGTDAYNAHWRPMLADFAKHLKQKGWFGKTAIAMDERPLADMQKAIALVRSADKEFKISLAGSYHRELSKELFDYCIGSGEFFEEDIRQQRKATGQITTYYTCCVEGFPNTFTFSPPAEATWLGWYAAAQHLDGYLRWAYNCWPATPMTDSRFGTWSAGDTYFVYPGAATSIRFERLIEGIQDYEKLRLLRASHGAQVEELLKAFQISKLKETPAADMLREAKRALNEL